MKWYVVYREPNGNGLSWFAVDARAQAEVEIEDLAERQPGIMGANPILGDPGRNA